jgi:hypothetical protein
MKLVILSTFAVLFILAGPLSASEMSEIELRDGSVIQAEINAFDGKSYTLHSDPLGTFQVDKSKVKSIHQKASEGTATGGGKEIKSLSSDTIKALQEKMVSNKDMLNSIASLQEDPDIQAVLQDPEIMKAITSADISTLMSNPKFMKLLSKPQIQDLAKHGLQ